MKKVITIYEKGCNLKNYESLTSNSNLFTKWHVTLLIDDKKVLNDILVFDAYCDDVNLSYDRLTSPIVKKTKLYHDMLKEKYPTWLESKIKECGI